MKQDSMKVLFFIRKSRLKKNGEAPVFLRRQSQPASATLRNIFEKGLS